MYGGSGRIVVRERGMSKAYHRFREMCKHSCDYGTRTVIPNQRKLRIDVRCSCGAEWHWALFGELKKRQPEGYVEWLFQDSTARRRLDAFVNGVLVVKDEEVE
jgi:hypothetical protein